MPGSSAPRHPVMALVLVLVLGGCSSESKKPQTLPTIKSPMPRMSPSAPTTPSLDTTDNTPEGAAAFVRLYYDQVNQAALTGRTDRVKSMTANECPCRALTKYIDDAYRAGALRGFVYTIRSVKTEDFKGKLALVAVLYTVGRIEELNKRGQVVGVVPPVDNGQKAVTVVRVANGWLIDNVQNLGK